MVSCRHHLLLDIHPITGRIYSQVDFDADSPEGIADAIRSLEDTCALDVAERGESCDVSGHGLTGALSIDEVGALLGIAGKNAHEIEQRALGKVAVLLADDHPDDPYFRMVAAHEMKKR